MTRKKIERNRLFVIIVMLIIFIGSCRTSKNNESLYEKKFLIIDIIEKGNIFIVDALNNQKRYRIITVKPLLLNTNCERIEIGGQYDLNIKRIYPLEKQEKRIGIEINVVDFEGESVTLRSISDSLFVASNLNGLCILNE